MSEYLEESAFEPMTEPFTHSQESPLPPAQPLLSEVATTSSATSYEGDTNSRLPLWTPSEPQYTKEIADYYGVSRKSVQEWYQKVKAVCVWLGEAELKQADGRYTPLCIALMGDYRISRLPQEAWKAKIWEENADQLAAFQTPPPAQEPERFPASESGNLIPYCPTSAEMQQFTPPARKLFKYTSTEAFVDQAKQQTEEGLDTTQSNSTHLVDALISQMKQEGQKLGVTLFQAKYGTAHAVMAELEQALAKKSGLVETEEQPTSPSPSV